MNGGHNGYVEEPSLVPLFVWPALLLVYISNIMLSLWQINICVDCLVNSWPYRFGYFIFHDLAVYSALDLWYWNIFLSSFGICILSILLK